MVRSSILSLGADGWIGECGVLKPALAVRVIVCGPRQLYQTHLVQL